MLQTHFLSDLAYAQNPFSFLNLYCSEIDRTELVISMNMEGYLKEIFSWFLPEVEEETIFVIPICSGVGSPGIFRAISFIEKGGNDTWAVAVQTEATSTPRQYKIGKLSNENAILVRMLRFVTSLLLVFLCAREEMTNRCKREMILSSPRTWVLVIFYILSRAERSPPRDG